MGGFELKCQRIININYVSWIEAILQMNMSVPYLVGILPTSIH